MSLKSTRLALIIVKRRIKRLLKFKTPVRAIKKEKPLKKLLGELLISYRGWLYSLIVWVVNISKTSTTANLVNDSGAFILSPSRISSPSLPPTSAEQSRPSGPSTRKRGSPHPDVAPGAELSEVEEAVRIASRKLEQIDQDRRNCQDKLKLLDKEKEYVQKILDKKT
ncbi:hypothetical protein BU23DRAFT_569260 [Bimuria novae-zelandiae CBS 107.79]|uniref:Uncharacterized protein n=1 Tax=Bimuria novae-zelandiae CBS 107.79 TaxID=1447943 RepID=A0A6A5V556_9PLEO|nr:hypothetical protein BU23DRAFT_569260 [Bimuria novae-zelandiae CBS 107.79]